MVGYSAWNGEGAGSSPACYTMPGGVVGNTPGFEPGVPGSTPGPVA